MISTELISPAVLDLLFTMSASGLLIAAGGLAAWMLPWSEQELQAVHESIQSLISDHFQPVRQKLAFVSRTTDR